MGLSGTDLKLLQELQQDCRQSLKDISKKLKLPLSTVHGKIKRFEQEKLIRGYSAVLDGEKLGEGVTAFVLVQCGSGHHGEKEEIKPRDICERIGRLPFVLESHVVTGQYDILIKLKGKSMRQIGNNLMEQIWSIPGVRNTQLLEAFYSAKETQALDLSQVAEAKQ